MKIADISFPHGLFLAPMAGVTDIPFRLLCKKYGAEGVFTEMVSSRALCYHDKKTAALAAIRPGERPCFLQIFGNEPERMAEAARLALAAEPSGIDINMGCPAPKIAGNGDGSALMKNPPLAAEIVRAVKAALAPRGIPVTVKIRAGFDAAHKNAVEVALACEAAGADAITVHGRTREQMYAPPVDKEIIRAVKRTVSVPVIANGDITDAASALSMFEETGCDGIMVGRGAFGNPYIFEEILCALDGKPFTPPDNERFFADICEHLEGLCALKGEYTGTREARKHAAWYLKGIPGAAEYRDKINRSESLSEILSLLSAAAMCRSGLRVIS